MLHILYDQQKVLALEKPEKQALFESDKLEKKLAKEDLQSLNLENKPDRLIATSSCLNKWKKILSRWDG